MLDVSNAELSERSWSEIPSRVELPSDVSASMRKEKLDIARDGCSRQYARRAFHKAVIVLDGVKRHACTTKDLSRVGVGFYAPVNFLPKKVIRLWLPGGEMLTVRVTRCRRLTERCYEVGASFCATG